MLRAGAIWIGLYLLCLFFSFISEVTYKKRSIQDVRQNWKPLVTQTTLVFVVFTVASVVWHYWGPQSRE